MSHHDDREPDTVKLSLPLGAEVEQRTPAERCTTCGELIVADDLDELWQAYTEHQVEEHGKYAERGPGGLYR